MIKGIDIYRRTKVTDFSKVKEAGYSFVYIKASEGADYHDPQYQPNAFNALKSGFPIGFYHFARPDHGNKPEAEAQNFVNAISVFKYNLLPVLDLEVDVKMDDDALYQWARAFANAVKAKTGHNVMLYTYTYYLKKYPALQKLHDLPLWIAYYGSNAPSISGWDWVMWQFTENATVPGIEGECDANYLKDLSSISVDKPKPKPADQKPPFKRVLKLTQPPMRGDDVKLLQKRLNVHPVDGIFGKQTEQAVKNWQMLHDEQGHVVKPGTGLVPDGIVGKKTWNALFS